MRASRLLSMLMLLQARGRVSATTLAREFEVSVRTVYRDADQLSAAGVPVYAERGRGGGFRLVDGFAARLPALTPGEAQAWALSGVSQAAADLGQVDRATVARRKVVASLPGPVGAEAARIAARFHVDPLPWYGRRPPPASLRSVADAVWQDRRLRLTYDSWARPVRRTVDPLGLVMKAGAWYLVAAARSRPRTYRVDAIRTLEVLPAPARRPAGFDLPTYWSAAAEAFEARLASERLQVRLTADGLRLLRDFHPRAWAAAQAADAVARADGRVEVTIPFEHGPQGVRDALRMGAEMEVLRPRAMRAAVAAEARRSARLHAPRRARGSPLRGVARA